MGPCRVDKATLHGPFFVANEREYMVFTPTTTEHGEEVGVYCVNCGVELTEETGVLASPDWYGNTRYVHYCRTCQQNQFEDFADNASPALAYFLCCAAYNLPFIPECMPSAAYDIDEMTWLMYLTNLENSERRYRDDGEPSAFVDGLTDLGVLFGGKIDAKTKFAYWVTMDGTSAKVPGTKAQRRKWGTISSYSTEDYKELDRLYSVRSADRLENGIDEETEQNLREICKLDLEYTKAMGKKDYDSAKKLADIRSKFMADNLLRKRDEAPVAPIKLDTLADALERAGYMKNGDLLGYDELLEKLRGDQPHYPMSHDYLDYVMREWVNCTKRNMGVAESDELPYELQIKPLYGEFDSGMSKVERNTLKELGLPPMQYEKKPKKGKKGE